jgi:maltooligosyltrehalose trehalohydrolase
VRIETPAREGAHTLERQPDGTFSGVVPGAGPGDLYRYELDDDGAYPDPASRFQPSGVHGPSQVIDARAFPWSDAGWRGLGLEDLVLYELHVGTFTSGGTFAAAAERLRYLSELGRHGRGIDARCGLSGSPQLGDMTAPRSSRRHPPMAVPTTCGGSSTRRTA